MWIEHGTSRALSRQDLVVGQVRGAAPQLIGFARRVVRLIRKVVGLARRVVKAAEVWRKRIRPQGCGGNRFACRVVKAAEVWRKPSRITVAAGRVVKTLRAG